MAHQQQQHALPPTLESMNISPVKVEFPMTLESYLAHPFNPWAPVLLFYVKFTVNPVKQVLFSRSDSRTFEYDAVSMGLVLARQYQGGGNLCIWSGLIIDGLGGLGVDAQMAKGVAKYVHDWIIDGERGWKTLKVALEVEMRVVTRVYVSSRMDMLASSSSSSNRFDRY